MRQRLGWVLQPDENASGPYTISSLYFDDIYNTSYHQKQSGVQIRNKLRIRYYNHSFDFMRLENKHKNGELISKESAPVTLGQYEKIRQGDYGFAAFEKHPVWQMFHTLRLTRALRPVVMVEYEREAFTCVPGNVRITFDTGLRASLPYSGELLPVFPGPIAILEVKYDSFLPDLLAGVLACTPLTQVAISKYVACREKLNNSHFYLPGSLGWPPVGGLHP